MAYGIIKIDTITFTDGGIDKSVAISGLVQNPTFTGNVTVTGTISGNTVRGQTVSGVTVTGTTAQFTSGTFVSLTGTTLQGTTATYTTGSFTSLTGTTTSGTTANFVSGVFSTQISGATVTGTTANFTSGNFTNISGGTHTITSGVFASGTAANPSISFVSDPNTGIYSPGADQVAISTNGSRGLLINSDGVVSVGRPDSAGTGLEIGAGATGNRSVVIDLIGDTTYSDYGLRLIRESTGANATSALVHRGTGGLYMVAVDSAPLVFSTVNQERMRLDSSGRLGLGTSSPDAPFQLSYSSSVTDQFNSGADAFHITNTNTTNNNWAQIFFTDSDAGGAAASFGVKYTDHANDYGELHLATRGSSGLASRLVVDSSGNVGIGTTSPSSNLTVGGNPPTSGAIGAVGSAGGIALALSDNTNSSLYVRTASGGAIIGTDGGGLIRFATGGNSTSDEKARIDASGRLLVGTSSSSSASRFVVQGNVSGGNYASMAIAYNSGGAISPDVTLGELLFTDQAAGNTFASITCSTDGTAGTSDYPGRLVFSTTADGASSPTERMRIQADGVVRVGDTVPVETYPGTLAAKGYHSKAGRDGSYSANVFNIYWNGTAARLWIDTTDQGSISVSSDYRVKKNVESQTETAAERIMLIRPVKYEYADYANLYRADGVQREGFIAHELAEVIPSAVDGEKDAPNQIQTLRLDALCSVLTKALQESITRIETLEAKVAALEAS